MRDRRIGRFSLPVFTVDERPEVDEIEYVGIHPDFRAVSLSEEVLSYVAEVTRNADGSVKSVRWLPK